MLPMVVIIIQLFGVLLAFVSSVGVTVGLGGVDHRGGGVHYQPHHDRGGDVTA